VTADDDPESADPTLARERTRLAWSRTALGLAAVGAVLLKFELAAGLIVVAGGPVVWNAGRGALRVSATQPLARRLLLVTVIVTLVSLRAVLVALLGHGAAVPHRFPPPHAR
jgi:uncharacterized membrane protein YidH (DUF202 family)